MNNNLTQTIAWAIAIILTARLTWSVTQHGMGVLDTLTIALCVLTSFKAGAAAIVNAAQGRRNGAAR